MDNISLSASIPIRRIIDGDTLSLWFSTNGVPLHQGLNPNDYQATPHWTEETGKHPEITPHITSATKQAVTLLSHKWSYNGVEIAFNSGTGWVKSSNFAGKFKMNTSTGTLAIIGDLASKDNQDADVVKYTGMASIGKSSYEMEKSIDILVTMLGSSAFFGGIEASSTMLGVVGDDGKEITTSILKFWLKNAGGDASKYSVKLYRGSDTTAIATIDNAASGGSITIHRDKTGDNDKLYVDSHQLFIAEFIVDGTVVYRSGISIDDSADLYQLKLSTDNYSVNSSVSSTIKAQVLNTSTGTAATLGSGTIIFTILDDTDLTVVRTVTKNFSNNAEFNAISFVVSNEDMKGLGVTVNCELNGTVL